MKLANKVLESFKKSSIEEFSSGVKWWYLISKDKKNPTIIDGPFSTEEIALSRVTGSEKVWYGEITSANQLINYRNNYVIS